MDVTSQDLSGSTFRDCNLSGARIVDAELDGLVLGGWFERLTVNDVDVTAFVGAELDRRHPERVRLRAVRDADDHRAMWALLEGLWADAVERGRAWPDERVDGEWSFSETLRHLVFATDRWVGVGVLDRADAFSALGLAPDARPSDPVGLDEVLEVRADRQALVRSVLDGLTDAGLEDLDTHPPSYVTGPCPVRRCLKVVLNEEVDHLRYAVRDLAVLEARLTG